MSQTTMDQLLPHQIRMIERVLEQFTKQVPVAEKSGLICHTARGRLAQTLAFLLQELLENDEPKKILVLVDRMSTQRQLQQLFSETFSKYIEMADSSEDLHNFLFNDSTSVMVATHQNFTYSTKNKDEQLSSRADAQLYVIAYNVHRYGGGQLIHQLHSTLPEAIKLGCSQGPVGARLIQGWGEVFDFYTLEDAIEDGLALPVIYEQRTFGAGDGDTFRDELDEIEGKFEFFSPARFLFSRERMTWVVGEITNSLTSHPECKAILVTETQNAAMEYEALFSQSEEIEAAAFISSQADETNAKNLSRFYDSKDSLRLLIVTNRAQGELGGSAVGMLFIDAPMSAPGLFNAINQINEPAPNKDRAFIIDFRDHSELLQQAILEASPKRQISEERQDSPQVPEWNQGLTSQDQRIENWTTKRLTASVVEVLQQVLIHQRPRWGSLLGHKSQYEGWWKAEFALALESWCWQFNLPYFWCKTEPKPKNAGIGTPDSKKSMDLVVAPGSKSKINLKSGPRVWLELKERGTWWQGDARKALGTANGGLLSDVSKWDPADFQEIDAVLACHIVVHDGTNDEYLPQEWIDKLNEVAIKYKRFVGLCIVGYPLAGDAVRWVRMDLFVIHMGDG